MDNSTLTIDVEKSVDSSVELTGMKDLVQWAGRIGLPACEVLRSWLPSSVYEAF